MIYYMSMESTVKSKPEPLQSRRTLPITSAITFLSFMDTALLIPVLALFASSLEAGIGITGLIIGLYSITNTPANILAGWLIDRIGYKVPLVTGLIGDTLSMFLYSLCRSPIFLALVRSFHGVTGGLIGPATMSVFAITDQKTKGRTMSYYGISLAAATLVGFGMSGIIADKWGYSTLFLFGVIMLAVGVVLGLLLPGSKQGVRTTASFSKTIKRIKGLLMRRGLSVSYCSIFAQYFTFGGVVTLLPIYVKSLGIETLHVGMLMGTFAVMYIVVQFPSGVISDKIGRLIPTIVALVLVIVSLVILPSLTTFPLLALAMGFYGIAYGLMFPSISALIADYTAIEERGIATGIFHALLTIGVAVGAPIMGWTGEMVGVKQSLMLVPAIMIIPLFLALFTFKRI